ncbi:hypothetical protein [Clostridium sp.]
MKEKGNPLLQIIRNVNDAVVVVLFLTSLDKGTQPFVVCDG